MSQLNLELEQRVRTRTRELEDSLGTLRQEMAERVRAQALVQRMADELEQRVAERTAQLESANAELEAFSYSVSHDLRAPLRSVEGFSQAMLEDCGERLDETGRGYLERIRSGGQRMGRIIDDLLKLSRANRGELGREEIDLSALCARIAADLARARPFPPVQVLVQPGMRVRGDSGLMQVLLENLLGNAWKFTSKCVSPRIQAGETLLPGGGRAFFIRDNGAGFSMAQADRLFHAFHRLHTEAEFQGTGIGLTIVQRIVRRHGGQVWAEAEPGQGAAFFFTVPDPV
jgi:signal transduction histidine kinase